ncbi:La-related protein 1C-like [Quillaja saponaria]|uniref:La-related protein 1C-like n=1 Tax=Quillaja saponaria TaxID=32244 RepID=A0AAD7LZ11_QUISA|nr:La-related protein 1C-like [Quillaja saponaria]
MLQLSIALMVIMAMQLSPKKLAWNKPSNGVIEVGPVMGAVSWPALSESTKVSAKSSADSYSKTVSDGSLSNSQGPVTSHSPKKQGTSNAKPNSATNHTMPNRQRSTKRSDGSNIGATPAQSSFTHSPPPPPLPPFPVFPISPSTYGNMVPGVPDPPPREFPYRNNSWDTRPVGGFVSQPHTMNDHRSNSRRGNFGHHPRGDGSYHNNYGGRRDQDRGNYANTRDTHVQQSRASPRGSVRPPPPSSAGFVAPQPLGFFAGPMGFPEFYYYPTPPLESLRGMPFITHAPPAMFLPVAEPPLIPMLINQIEYYFSDANLIKDEFLRSNMDDQGWVPITLIASFPRVRSLTSNPQLILDSLRTSTVVEVQGEKMRRRNEWTKWLPSSGQLSTESGSESTGGLSYDTLLANLQKVAVDEATTDTVKADPNSEASPGTCSTESSVQSQIPNGDTTKKTN